MAKDAIFVSGATGYVGSHTVALLRESGYTVYALVRPTSRREDRNFLESTGATTIEADLLSSPQSAFPAIEKSKTIIHLIGSISPPRGQSSESLHHGQMEKLIELAKKAGCKRIILVTACGTAADAKSVYHRTKYQSEKALKESGINYLILRPSLIVGKEVGERDSKLVVRYRTLINSGKAVPLIGGGQNKVQPIFVKDLAKVLVAAAAMEKLPDTAVDLGGNEIMTMKDFVQRLARTIPTAGALRFKDLSIPMANVAAGICELMQNQPLLSKDQVLLAQSDNICQVNGMVELFKMEPSSLDEALSSYRRQLAGTGSAR